MKFIHASVLFFGLLHCAVAAEKLPKVLIIADGIHRSTAKTAAAELQGRVDVVVPESDLGDTGAAIELLGEVLGESQWDLIYFNFGFADLRHIDPKTKAVRVMSRHAGGKRVTSPQKYQANLEKIVTRLKDTGAKLIWASSTPLVGTKYDGVYESGSEIEYNTIAAEIMQRENIAINDMHAWVLQNVKKFTDSFSFRRIPIHEPMVESIEKALVLSGKKSADEKQK
ncbi:MAG: hypothetical protein AB8D78_14275 [Akkermansiaceae bacterium]